jgi:hypothetical protein
MPDSPQALLVVLSTLVVALIAKDILNGMLRRPFLNPDAWQPLPLVDVKQLSHNTRRFRFALPHQEQLLGLPLGQHISIKGTAADGSEVMRCAPSQPACSACFGLPLVAAGLAWRRGQRAVQATCRAPPWFAASGAPVAC